MSNYLWYVLNGNTVRPVDPGDYEGLEFYVWGNGCFHIIVGTARNVTTLTQRHSGISREQCNAHDFDNHGSEVSIGVFSHRTDDRGFTLVFTNGTYNTACATDTCCDPPNWTA